MWIPANWTGNDHTRDTDTDTESMNDPQVQIIIKGYLRFMYDYARNFDKGKQ